MHFFAFDAGQIVADAEIENGFAGRAQQCIVAEYRIAAEHFDEHGAGHVFAQRMLDEQFLRPFDVVADVGHVDAGSTDGKAVVHLHRFELEDSAACHVAQQNVLGHLGVWPSGGPGGVAGEFAVEVDGEIVAGGLGNVPPAARKRKERVLRVAPRTAESPDRQTVRE